MVAPSSVSKRIVWVDVVRGMAAIAIVLSHSYERLAQEGQVAIMGGDGASYGDLVRMPAIIFVSGVFLLPSLKKDNWDFAWSKISKVAWPFLVWSPMYYAIWMQIDLLPHVVNPVFTGIALLVKPILHLWFLQHLLIFFAISWSFFRKSASLLKVAVCTVIFAIPPLIIGSLSTETFQQMVPASVAHYITDIDYAKMWLARFGTMLLFFNVGISARIIGVALIEDFIAKRVLLLALLTNLMVVVASLAFAIPKYSAAAAPISLLGVAGFASIAIGILRAQPIKAALIKVGSFSLEIYILHLMIILGLQRVLAPVLSGLPDLLTIGIIAALAVPIAMLMAEGSRRYLGNIPFSLPDLARPKQR